MGYSTAFQGQGTQKRLIPHVDVYENDMVTEEHDAKRRVSDLQVVVRKIPPRSLPPREMKVRTERNYRSQKNIYAQSAALLAKGTAARTLNAQNLIDSRKGNI